MFSRSESVLLALIAAAGLAAAALFWNQAFPTAALSIEVTEPTAKELCRAFLKQAGHPVDDYKSAAQFGEKTGGKYFLERERGVQEMEKLVRKGITLWDWNVRFFKPEQEEEFDAQVNPQGSLVGYYHKIPEAQAAPFLTMPQARAKAEEFLAKFVPREPLGKLAYVEGSSVKRPNRTDYHFTWERPDLRVGDAPYRIYVWVQGDEVGLYSESVKVPEAWARNFETKRELNNFFEDNAGYSELLILMALLVILVQKAAKRQLRWKDAVPLRWYLLFAVVLALSMINSFEETINSYQTTDVWNSFLFLRISYAIRDIIVTLGGFYLMTVVAEAMYREKLPEMLYFRECLGKDALSQPETVRGLGVGIAFACFGVGYVCAFYVVANHFGAWSPIDLDYSKLLEGPMPWTGGIYVGMHAAWYEELFFRVVGILFFWMMSRNRWIGVVLAGVTWAFLHSTYPQMPGYIRGLELSAEGILWGFLMFRYGIVSTLTAHYLYDCWLSSLVILPSPDWSHRLGAIAVSMWPVALWLIGLCRLRAGRLARHHVIGEEEKIPEPADAEVVYAFAPRLLDNRQRLFLLIATAGLAALMYFGPHPARPMNKFGKVDLSREEISVKADEVLRAHGQDPSRFHRVISLHHNLLTAPRYLIEFKPLREMAKLYGKEWPDMVWTIRYFRFLEDEEFLFDLDKSGHLQTWVHTVPREAPGASLERDQALAVAQTYLAGRKIDIKGEKLVEDEVVQQEKRRDYHFEWQRANWHWGDSELRTTVNIQGDEPVSFERYVKIPDEWLREKEKTGWKETILSTISHWFALVLTVVCVVFFIVLVLKRRTLWRLSFKLSLFPAALSLVHWFNHFPWFYSDYLTTQPPNFYFWKTLGDELLGIVGEWFSYGVSIAVVFALLHWAFGWTPESLRPAKWRLRDARVSLADLLILVMFSIAIWWSCQLVENHLSLFAFPNRDAAYSTPTVNDSVPWISDMASALRTGMDKLLFVAAIFSVGTIIHRRWPWAVWGLVFAMPFYNALAQETSQEYFLQAAVGLLDNLLMLVLILRVWRFDAALIFASFALNNLILSGFVYWTKGGPAYRDQMWPLIIGGIVVIWACMIFRTKEENYQAQLPLEEGLF